MAESSERKPAVQRESARAEQRGAPDEPGPQETPPVASLRPDLGALLSDPRLSTRGNGPVRAAALQRAQQIYGNRAVQRMLAAGRTPAGLVQRQAPTTGTPGSVAGGVGNAVRTGYNMWLQLQAGDALAAMFDEVVLTNAALASAVSIPATWGQKVREYAAANPADGLVLLAGMARLPTYYEGGWILDIVTNAQAMTLNRSVFGRPSWDIVTYVHEMVHVAQYGVSGIDGFLVDYFALSALTIAERLVTRQPLRVMDSSPHEHQAYAIADRFATWLAAHPLPSGS